MPLPVHVEQEEGEERPTLIQVSAKDVVKFVLELLMMQEKESASRALSTPEKPSSEGDAEAEDTDEKVCKVKDSPFDRMNGVVWDP